jgi:hypothetical protein
MLSPSWPNLYPVYTPVFSRLSSGCLSIQFTPPKIALICKTAILCPMQVEGLKEHPEDRAHLQNRNIALKDIKKSGAPQGAPPKIALICKAAIVSPMQVEGLKEHPQRSRPFAKPQYHAQGRQDKRGTKRSTLNVRAHLQNRTIMINASRFRV